MMPMCECEHETCPCSRNRRIASVRVMRGDKRLYVCSGCELTTDEAAPRFVVKMADEMLAGEPGYRFFEVEREWLQGVAAAWEREGVADVFVCSLWVSREGITGAIVDTHDAWHTTRVEAPPLELPEIAEPAKPTDAEIVAAWEAEARRLEIECAGYGIRQVSALHIRDGFGCTFREYQEARSRELKRKQAEARGHRVICEDQYEL